MVGNNITKRNNPFSLLNSTTSVVGNNTCTTKRNSTILLIVLYKLQWWASILQRVTVQISLLYCTNFNGGHRYFKEKRSHSHYCTELTSMVGMDTSKRNSPILICVLCKLQRWAWILKRVTCLFVWQWVTFYHCYVLHIAVGSALLCKSMHAYGGLSPPR